MATSRFSTYLTEDERRELDVLNIELGLPKGGNKSERERRLLVLMKMVTQAVIEEIRTEKRAAGQPALASWKELAARAGIPEEIARRAIEGTETPQSAVSDGQGDE